MLYRVMREEAIAGLGGLDLTKPAEDVKTLAAILKAQLNFTTNIINFPSFIKYAGEAQAGAAAQKVRFIDSQKGVTN